MRVLALESSAKSASVSFVEDGIIKCEMYLSVGLTHSATLMPLVKSCMEYANCKISELDLIAVANGPGSFTGVRIGVATAKGLAQKDNIACIGISSLEAIAYNFLNSGALICSVMDARCSQVYTALFKSDNSKIKRISEDEAISIDALNKKLAGYNEKIIICGDGTDVCRGKIEGKNIVFADEINKNQRACSVAIAAVQSHNSEEYINSSLLVPAYLRLPQATRELAEKQANKQI